MNERFVATSNARICFETFGQRQDPAILLIHGACASMLWWEQELCESIAARGRFVVRYDSRDTGLSTSWPAGQPGYSLRDMVNDAVAILDHLGIVRAHIVGRSMAGAIATALGLEHRDRVATLTYVATTPGSDGLSPMSPDFLAATSQGPDFSSPSALEEGCVAAIKAYSGGSPYFDAQATRELVRQDLARSRDMAASLTNHYLIAFDAPARGGLADLRVPSLIVHGEHDPVFPLDHGLALVHAIRGAQLLVLRQAGHELPPPLWPEFVQRLADHTADPQAARKP